MLLFIIIIPQKLNFHVQFCRTNALKKGEINMGIKLYNILPNKIREEKKRGSLKES
jgi:hypothetical protein